MNCSYCRDTGYTDIMVYDFEPFDFIDRFGNQKSITKGKVYTNHSQKENDMIDAATYFGKLKNQSIGNMEALIQGNNHKINNVPFWSIQAKFNSKKEYCNCLTGNRAKPKEK